MSRVLERTGRALLEWAARDPGYDDWTRAQRVCDGLAHVVYRLAMHAERWGL